MECVVVAVVLVVEGTKGEDVVRVMMLVVMLGIVYKKDIVMVMVVMSFWR